MNGAQSNLLLSNQPITELSQASNDTSRELVYIYDLHPPKEFEELWKEDFDRTQVAVSLQNFWPEFSKIDSPQTYNDVFKHLFKELNLQNPMIISKGNHFVFLLSYLQNNIAPVRELIVVNTSCMITPRANYSQSFINMYPEINALKFKLFAVCDKLNAKERNDYKLYSSSDNIVDEENLSTLIQKLSKKED